MLQFRRFSFDADANEKRHLRVLFLVRPAGRTMQVYLTAIEALLVVPVVKR